MTQMTGCSYSFLVGKQMRRRNVAVFLCRSAGVLWLNRTAMQPAKKVQLAA